MRKLTIALALLAAPLGAAEPAKPVPSPGEIVAAAAKADWVAIAPADLLVMDLAPGAKDKPRRVVIQLMPPPFSQGWIGNIRTLAKAHWWDGLSVNRVQDNYVAQWGDGDGEDKAKARALPAGLRVMPETDYEVSGEALSDVEAGIAEEPKSEQRAITDRNVAIDAWAAALDASNVTDKERIALISIDSTKTASASQGWHERDSVAPWVEIWRGWPIGNAEVLHWEDDEGRTVAAPSPGPATSYRQIGPPYRVVDSSQFWPVHCYGMVGVGRDLSPNTGSGAELYTVIGHAPRHLDRNIALVGRVIEGIEHLSSLPRGTGTLGFYETPEERTKIASVRLGTEVTGLPSFEYLSTESEAFARYADARANRRDPFFIRPAGGADVCNITVPVRRAK